MLRMISQASLESSELERNFPLAYAFTVHEQVTKRASFLDDITVSDTFSLDRHP